MSRIANMNMNVNTTMPPDFPFRSRSNGSEVLESDIAQTESEIHDLHMFQIESQLDDLYVNILKTRFFGLGKIHTMNILK